MRQQAHRMRRPSRRRRAGVAAAGAVLVLLGATGLAWRPSSAAVPGGTDTGPGGAMSLEPLVPPDATLSPADAPAAPPLTLEQGPMAGVRGLAPAHVALDAWPRPEPARLSALTGYVWPIAHPRLTLPFGPTPWGSRVVDGRLFHDGVDLATFCNDRIMATHDGTVLAAGRQFDSFMGWVGRLDRYFALLDQKHMWPDLPIVVVIDDGNGYRSVYAHMWKVTVKPGQRVHAGQLIGYEGMTGHATGCHLHYGLFSPLETATFGIDPGVAARLRLPPRELARVDPLLVLPYREGISGPDANLGSG